MDWAHILAYVTGTVDQELLARNEYLAAENRILKAQLEGRLKLSDAERATLGEIGLRGASDEFFLTIRVAIERRPALAAIEEIDGHAMTVMQGESARIHHARLEDAAVAPVLRRRLAKGLAITDAELAASIGARARLVRDFEESVLAGNDVAVLPVMAIATPSAIECDPSADRFSPRTLYALSRFTRFVNMLGFPAVALPTGFDHRGMPVGVQIVGCAGCDLALIDLVRHLQSTSDWHARVPTAVADLLPD